ncbi:MAG: sugar phosphate nucleotidyltransferase, partial [Anaerolineaceae bacterium]|nr:sugar phosphate nucleotidyltransferase [Anaerolineaceae bacterium]
EWYQGTADAVRKQIFEIQSARTQYVLILAGDHLYNMDYSKMAEFHWKTNADITVAVQPVPKSEASRFGILKRDSDFRIIDFSEKPKEEQVLASMVSRDDKEKPYLGSMGIYLFNLKTLVDVLSLDNKAHDLDDFGGDIIPYAIKNNASVYGYDFNGYWRDIGTIRSFYETNLALAEADPPFNLYDQQFKIFTHPRFLPGSRLNDCRIKNVLIAEGCCIEQADIEHSVIGVRSQIGSGTRIKDTVMIGADYYNPRGDNPIGIGKNCDIEGAIIDKNVCLGDNVIIKPFPPDFETDHYLYNVREGVVVIPKNKVIPSGTVIKPED